MANKATLDGHVSWRLAQQMIDRLESGPCFLLLGPRKTDRFPSGRRGRHPREVSVLNGKRPHELCSVFQESDSSEPHEPLLAEIENVFESEI
jgi:hypothetical protein